MKSCPDHSSFLTAQRRPFKQFGAEQPGLEAQVKNGPYPTTWRRSAGHGGSRVGQRVPLRIRWNSVAAFTTQDGARWKVVMDRIPRTQDVPHHPRFGGVILGLY